MSSGIFGIQWFHQTPLNINEISISKNWFMVPQPPTVTFLGGSKWCDKSDRGSKNYIFVYRRLFIVYEMWAEWKSASCLFLILISVLWRVNVCEWGKNP